MTARVLYPSGRLRHAGYEFRMTPTLDGDRMLPSNRLRGVPLGYKPSLKEHESIWALDGFCVLVQRKALLLAGGLQGVLAPDYHWAEASLKMAVLFPTPGAPLTESNKKNINNRQPPSVDAVPRFGYVPTAVVYYTPPPSMNEIEHNQVADPLLDSPRRRWFLNEAHLEILPVVPPQLRVMWDMHCGGSMGIEAAYFMKELETKLDLRVHPPRYGPRCEHLVCLHSSAFMSSFLNPFQ
jgi:hypothetical protein